MPRNYPIRRRLQMVIVLTTSLALGLSCVIFIFFEWRSSLDKERQALLSLGRITANASSASLAFSSANDAEAVLSTFRDEPDIRAAALYDAAGKLVADYQMPNAITPIPTSPEPDGLRTDNGRMLLFHPVIEAQKRYGTLYLRADLRDMYERMYRYGGTVLIIFASAVAAAYGIGRVLQRRVSDPILELAKTARSISQDHNYAVRASTRSSGELGLLTDAFNHMLNEIQQQQAQLHQELTERQRAQDAEARERRLLATTLASIGDAVIVTNASGEVTFLNAEAERLTGWKNEEARGLPLPKVFQIVHEGTRRPAENPVTKVLQSGTVVGLANHTILVGKDGTETPIDDSAAPIREPEGPLSGVVLVFRDFTEQKRAQEARARLAAIVETSGDAIYTKNLDGIIQTWNASAQRLLGYSPADIIGKSITLLVPPDRLDEEREIFARLRQDRPAERLETFRVSQSGRRIPVSLSISPLKDAGGRVTGASTIIHDISDVIAAREALFQSEERFRAVAENIPQLAWMTDPEGAILWYNRRWLEYTGTTLEQMQGSGWRLVHHPDHGDRVLSRWRQSLKNGTAWEDLFPLRRHDGQYRWFLSRAFPIRNDVGTITRWFGTNTDVTELRDAQEALQQAKTDLQKHAASLEATVAERTAKLRETVGELEAFSYSIAHDMRAPLRAMQGFSTMLRDEYADKIGDEGKDYLRRISASANRLDHLIQDVLNYSKIVRAEVHLEPMDTYTFISEIIQSYPNLYPDRAQIDLDPGIPPILANPAALTQVVSNLLGNAVKFVKPGVKPRVRIWAETRVDSTSQPWVRLWFEDNGIGIRPEVQDRIFLMFQRLNPPGEYEGTGIGLTIVRKAVERMGGEVGVESEPGQGSRFWIQLKPVTTK